MSIVVVGGQARKVGKTSVVEAIVSALPERRWTAVKITQCHHEAPDCHCELGGAESAVSEEVERGAGRDTSRYLAAEARKAFWVRTKGGALAHAMPALNEIIRQAEIVIIESNSFVELVRPDVFVCVAGPVGLEMKASYRSVLNRADALVTLGETVVVDASVPVFRLGDSELCAWLEKKLEKSRNGLKHRQRLKSLVDAVITHDWK